MRKIVISIILIGFMNAMYAQDPHFSQFYNAPLKLNPALTGKINGAFRFALNYRNQWFSLVHGSTPFATYSGSFDMPIRLRQDALGVGLVILNDQSAEGRLNSFNIMASVAYHKALGKNGNHSLSLGAQLGYAEKRFAINEAVFFDPMDPLVTNSSSDPKTGAFDFQIGLLANSKITKKVNVYGGFSMFHVIEPGSAFYQNSDEKLRRKYVVHAGAEYVFAKRVAFVPSLIYMNQNKVDELNLGTAFIFRMSHDNSTLFILGAYYRMVPQSRMNGNNLSDAAIAYTGFEFKNFRVGFSYDATTSSLQKGPGTVGAFEVSLSYVHPFRLPAVKTLLFCPRF